MVGASLSAKAAADALSCINVSNAVFNADGVMRADLLAITKAHAAVGAMPSAAVKHVGGGAGLYAPVILFVFIIHAVAMTMHESDLLDNVGKLNAKHL